MNYGHLIFGIGVFVVFLVTGGYMRVDFPDKDAIPQDLRLLMRSRHIYILFSSLIHIALGVYLTLRPRLWQKIVQFAGSAVLAASTILLVWAWYVETYQTSHFTDISREGIYLSLAGIILHLIGGLNLKRSHVRTRFNTSLR